MKSLNRYVQSVPLRSVPLRTPPARPQDLLDQGYTYNAEFRALIQVDQEFYPHFIPLTTHFFEKYFYRFNKLNFFVSVGSQNNENTSIISNINFEPLSKKTNHVELETF